VADQRQRQPQRLEIPFNGKWQITDDPLLLDENSFSDIKNMRPTDKSIKGVNGYTKVNTAPFYSSYNYTSFTEVDTDTRVGIAAHTITVADLDTDEDAQVYYDEGAGHFDGDFEHQLQFKCTDPGGICGLWALANGVDDLTGLAGADTDHLALYLKDLYDYTAFTETDVPARVTAAENTITVANLDTDEDVYVHRDMGAGNADLDGSFEHKLQFKCTSSTNGICGLWAISNDDPANGNGLYGLADNDLDHLALFNESNDSFDKVADPGTLPASSGNGAAFNHDGSLLAVAHSTSPYVTIYNTSDWSKVADPGTLPASSGYGAAFNHDGSLLAVAHSTSPYVTIYNTSDWSKVADPGTLPTGLSNGAAFNHDGSLLAVAHGTSPYVTIYNGIYSHLTLKETNGATDTIDSYTSLSQNTDYYLTLKRDEAIGTYGTLYAYIYSDSARTTLVDTLTVTLTEKQDFRYLFGMISYDSATGNNAWSGTISNLVLSTGQWLVLRETNGAVDTEVESALLSLSTDYYLTIERDEAVGANGTLYARIYSDEARATLIETLTLSLTEKQDFRYIYAMISWDSASGGNSWSGTISNLTGAIHDNILSGYHFNKDQPAESHVLIQAANSAGTTAILDNKTAIPDQGNFESSTLYTEPSGASRGQFVAAPQGNVVYCNGKESLIWGGDELRCAAFILSTAAITNTVTNARDFTEQIQNTLDDSDEIAALGGSYMRGVIGSTRPVKGVKIYIKTANDTASNIQFKEWTGTAWSDLTEADNTAAGDISLAKTGTITWGDTKATSKPKYLEGRIVYFYQFVLSAGSAEISHITVDASFQTIKNIWSGDPSVVAACKKYDTSVYHDYTIEVNDAITTTIADVSGLVATTHKLLLGFLSPQQGFEVFVPAGKGNGTASVLTIKYNDGDSFEAVSTMHDGTAEGGATIAGSGVINFTPPARGTEFPTTISKEGPYYYYEFTVSATLDAEAQIYYITGIPNPPKISAHKFAVSFQTRTLLCSPDESPEAVLVSAENAPDVYNGDDSTTLYFGEAENLISGIGLYNRHGSSIYNMAALCKNTETWILTGFSPDTFEKNKISGIIGNAAPLTMDTCEVGYQLGKVGNRNITIWLPYAGPVVFDGGVIMSMEGIEPYFDPNDSRCVNYSAIDSSIGKVDPLLKEYNLLIPSGVGQTTPNVWLVCDLIRMKWFKKEPPTYPQCIFRAEDTNGAQYGFIGFNDGYVRHNENGTTFDGTAIDQSVTLRDVLPTKSMWDVTQIDFLKLMVKAKFNELCPNGDMEIDDNWNDYNTPTTNERSNEQAHGGTYSRKFVADGVVKGIESDSFTTITDVEYSYVVWVYPVSTTDVYIFVQKGIGGYQYNHLKQHTGLTQNTWNRIAFSCIEAAGGSSATIVVTSSQAGTWYVDDVSVLVRDLVAIEYRADGDESWTSLTSVPMYATGKRYSKHVQRVNKQGVSHELKLSCSTSDKVDGFSPIALGILYSIIRTDTTLG